jgi:hypothetical protein
MAETNTERLTKLEERLLVAEKKVEEIEKAAALAQASLEAAQRFATEILPTAQQAAADVNKYKESAKSSSEDVQTVLNQSREAYNSLAESESAILGEKASDGTRQGGLKADIQEEFELIHEQSEKASTAFEELKTKIEGLLPGATSAGLAEAYKTQKDTYWWGGVIWPTVFIAAVGAIVAIGLLSFQEITTAATLEMAIVKLIARLPYYLAAVWLAAFASKRQSQNKRLQQEYAHKETVSKSLEGYKREVSALPDPTVLADLMKAVVEMLKFNPSKTLDGRHGDDSAPTYSLFRIFSRGKKAEKDVGEE